MAEADPRVLLSGERRVRVTADKRHDADIASNIGAMSRHEMEKDTIIEWRQRSSDLHPSCCGDLEEDAVSIATQAQDDANNPKDPNIVFWDGPNDPQNPLNWSAGAKWGGIAVVSGITFLSPLGSALVAPGVPGIMETFSSHSEILSGFIVSVYVLGFAVGPLLIAPMSEMWGRLPLYHSCQALFILFNLGCALSTSLGMLITFRFLAGCVGAAPLTLGGGTIADLIPREQRGVAMAMWVLGPTLGPTLGPIAGGFISNDLTWRWNFWILMMCGGVSTVLGLILMRETYAPTILARKTRRLQMETGNMALRSKLDTGLTPVDLFKYSIVRPSKMLLFCPTVQAMSAIVAIEYSYLYILFTTFTTTFQVQYHFAPSIVGLSFLGLGLGQLLGQIFYTVYGDRPAKQHMAKGDFEPEHRLPPLIWGGFLLPGSLFLYAWTTEYKIHWIVPIIATAFFGFGLLLTFMPANTYLVDVYTVHAASAMAANTVLRSVIAAVLPLSGPTMYRKLGLGWGNSALAFIAMAMIPVSIIFKRYGKAIREGERVKL